MNPGPTWRRHIRLGRTRRHVEAEVDDELRTHMEGLAERYVRDGMSKDEAWRKVTSECEDLVAARSELVARAWTSRRRSRRREWLIGFAQDLKTSVRRMRRQPGFAALVLVTLGLGIGANSAAFSAVRSVLLTPLPYPEPDRLMTVWMPWEGDRFNPVSALDWEDLKQRSSSFQEWGVCFSEPLNLSGDADERAPAQVQGVRTSAGTLRALGVGPERGRLFLPEETGFPIAHAAVVSHRLWQGRFGSDPDLVGRTILLNEERWTVIGILPRDFQFPEWTGLTRPDVYLPLVIDPSTADRGSYYLSVIGRLAHGRSLDQAREELSGIAAHLAKTYPDTNGHRGVQIVPLRQIVLRNASGRLWTLLAVSGLVLLLSCANVVGLLVARNLGRRVEVAIRTSLGAGRGRLVRQFLTEVLTLGLLSGGVGLLIAWLGTEFLMRFLPQDVLKGRGPHMDGLVVSVTFVVTLLTSVLAGAFPALVSSDMGFARVLREGSHALTAERAQGRLLRVMVVVQFALAFVLVNVAVLMVGSLREAVSHKELREPQHVLVAGYLHPRGRSEGMLLRDPFLTELLQEVRAIPGVSEAGATTTLPLRGFWSSDLLPEGQEYDPDRAVPSTQMVPVSPGYFAAMGITLLRGRDIESSDLGSGSVGVVVNQAFAARSWPGEDPLGKKVHDNAPSDSWLDAVVVGVVKNVRQQGLERSAGAAMYVPFFPYFQQNRWVVMRTSGDPAALMPAYRATLSRLDPNLPITDVFTGEELYWSMARGRAATTNLFGLFALIALSLAAAGNFGVMSFLVGQRLREIGVRVALGARRWQVIWSVMSAALALVSGGIGVGLLGAWGASRVVQGLLYGVKAGDPVFVATAALVLGLTAIVATGIPALRAARADPVDVMKGG